MGIENINRLPFWAKASIIAVGFSGLAFITYKVIKSFSDIKDTIREKDVVKEVEKEIISEIKKGEKLSKPLSAYKSLANTIQGKLNGCDSVTDEVDVIKGITYVVKNKLDWATLVKVFGVRKIDDCLYGSENYELGNLLKTQLDQDLIGWYSSPLSPLGNNPIYKIVGDGFIYDTGIQGNKKTIDVLKIYLNKIGVTI